MTVKEAKSKIINHLFENSDKKDSISFDELNSLIPTSENKEEYLTALLSALTELVNEQVLAINPLSDINKPQTICWVLKEKIFLREQKRYRLPKGKKKRLNWCPIVARSGFMNAQYFTVLCSLIPAGLNLRRICVR